VTKHNRICFRLAGLAFAAASVLGAVNVEAQTQTRKVHVNNVKVLAKKQFLADSVATLRIRTKVQILEEGKGWTKIKTPPPNPKIGYVRTASLEPKKKGMFGNTSGASDREAAQAGRGYNPQVEGQYKKNNPKLQPAFAKLDQIIADPVNKVSASEARAFLAAGGVKSR